MRFFAGLIALHGVAGRSDALLEFLHHERRTFASRRIRLLYHFPSRLLFRCTFSPIRVIGGAIGMSLACTRFPQIPRLFRVLLECECYIICILGRYWKGRVHIDGPRFFWSALIIG